MKTGYIEIPKNDFFALFHATSTQTLTMNPNYKPLTAEQKRRKQAIRNWKREQADLIDAYKFACLCRHVYEKDLEAKFYVNLKYTLGNLFEYHDEQDEKLYQSHILCESIVENLLN